MLDPSPTTAALDAARKLLASVDRDNNGDVVGMVRQGGNGGMISRDTTMAADALRRALDRLEQER